MNTASKIFTLLLTLATTGCGEDKSRDRNLETVGEISGSPTIAVRKTSVNTYDIPIPKGHRLDYCSEIGNDGIAMRMRNASNKIIGVLNTSDCYERIKAYRSPVVVTHRTFRPTGGANVKPFYVTEVVKGEQWVFSRGKFSASAVIVKCENKYCSKP